LLSPSYQPELRPYNQNAQGISLNLSAMDPPVNHIGGGDMAMAASLPPIQSFAEAEALILKLYSRGIPSYELIAIQKAIQDLQKSENGWELADALMGSTHSNVRFIGGLTFSVKLNNSDRYVLV
jgi:hypothetical protein